VVVVGGGTGFPVMQPGQLAQAKDRASELGSHLAEVAGSGKVQPVMEKLIGIRRFAGLAGPEGGREKRLGAGGWELGDGRRDGGR
jgi:hypothetical protein